MSKKKKDFYTRTAQTDAKKTAAQSRADTGEEVLMKGVAPGAAPELLWLDDADAVALLVREAVLLALNEVSTKVSTPPSDAVVKTVLTPRVTDCNEIPEVAEYIEAGVAEGMVDTIASMFESVALGTA